MSEAVKKNRQKFGVMTFADIMHYRLPLAAYLSILHRASGALLFALLPFVLYLLDLSLTSEISFEHLKGVVSTPQAKVVILILVWGYLHHFFAGIRHLFMDFHVCLDKESGRKTSIASFVVSLVPTALVALKLFGAF